MTNPRFLIALLLCLAVSSVAAAQDDSSAPRITERDKLVVKALLGLGGDADIGKSNADLDPSFGGAAQYERLLSKLFVLGGYAALQSWNTAPGEDIGLGRSTLVDVSALLKLRLPLNESAELYVAPLLGLTLDSAANDAFGGDTNLGIGWNFSALAGGQLAFSRSLGIMGEMGYGRHAFSHTVKPTGGGARVDADVTMQQFNVTLGMYFVL
jgi:hypothetical protein